MESTPSPAANKPTPTQASTPEETPTAPPDPQLESPPECPSALNETNSCPAREVRDVSEFGVVGPRASGAAGPHSAEAPSVEEILEKGRWGAGVTPTHIVVRGTPGRDSVRCAWRGAARTTQQREVEIRFWLGMDEAEPLPPPDEVLEQFMSYVRGMAPRHQPTWETNVTALSYGGLTTDALFLACYADYRAHKYVLGDGDTPVTVAYDPLGEAESYQLYSRSHAAGKFQDEPLMNEAQYQAHLDGRVKTVETLLADIVAGSESVVFLAPLAAYGGISVEAWLAVAQWDVQLDETGTVNAVGYGTPRYDPEHTQTLAILEERITTASASDKFSGKRIGHTSGLTQYYRDIGAYGDITPYDDDDSTFVPAQPPPALVAPYHDGSTGSP